MLRVFLARACERELFTQLFLSESHTNDLDEFLSRLHFCIADMQGRTNHVLKLALSEPLNVNYFHKEDSVNIEELEEAEYSVCYKKNNQPFQRRKIFWDRI